MRVGMAKPGMAGALVVALVACGMAGGAAWGQGEAAPLPIRVERLRIEGNWKTRDDVIRREVVVSPGDIITPDKLRRSAERLRRTGLFSEVAVRLERGAAADSRDVVIAVKEAETGRLLAGLSVTASGGVNGRVGVALGNFDLLAFPTSLRDFEPGRRTAFAGGGQTLRLLYEPGTQRTRVSLHFAEPYLVPRLVPFQLGSTFDFSFMDTVQQRTYTERRLEGGLGLWHEIADGARIALAYRATAVDLYSFDDDASPDALRAAGDSLVTGMGIALSYREVDVDPLTGLERDGLGLRLFTEVASPALGGDVDLWRVEASGLYRLALFEWPERSPHTLALRSGFAVVRPFGDTDEVPIFERYFAGGPGSVRGFEVRSLGPQADDEPIGGEIRLTGAVEYAFPIIPGLDETYDPAWRSDFLRGAVFLDAGIVEREVRDFTFDDVRLSAGFGVRIRVPYLGPPLALDFAFPLLKERGDDREVFSFSAAVAF